MNRSPRHDQGALLESRFVVVRGLRWHFRAGLARPGPPIVLIPGLVISSSYMVPLAAVMAARHSVFAIDLPGFGLSEAPDSPRNMPQFAEAIVRWMETLRITECHLVANSMGCQIAAHLAAEWPEHVRTATLIGATIDPLRHRFRTQFAALVRDAFQEPPQLWQIWIRDFFRAGIVRSIATTHAMFADRIEQQLPRIAAKVLFIRGGIDPTVPARWNAEAAQMTRHGCGVEIPGEPHCVHYTTPEPIAKLIDDWITSRASDG